jgi:DNA-binding SARP family transcriptional activator
MTYVAPGFSILGPVEMVTATGARTSPGGRKKRELLALLLLHRNRSVSSGQLVEELWGETAPGGAEITLRSHVSHLRKWLADAGAGELLTTGPAGYLLAPEPGRVDTDRFERLIGEGQEALGLGRADRAEATAREALALWRDRPLPELPEVEAAGVEVARLEELRLVALEVRGAAQLQLGRHREAVAELDALVSAHPFRERFCGQLMVALYRCGRQADALAAYASMRERLADELGLDPGPELQGLSQQILRQDPELLGDEPTLPVAPAPAPASADAPSRPPGTALPDALLAAASRAPLVGRARELHRLRDAWATAAGGGHRVVLLSGEPGIGKTRLVAELAGDASQRGRTVLVGRCEGTGLAYHPVADALRSSDAALDAIAEAADGVRAVLDPLVRDAGDDRGGTPVQGGQRSTLHSAVTLLLRGLAAADPVLLVVEDAERIDRASALLLRHLVDRLPPGLALVICFRDPPGARHEPLGELLGALTASDLVDRIVLAPLDERETADLVQRTSVDIRPDVAERVWERTGGNPFFSVEVARSLTPDRTGDPAVPAGVRDALRLRLQELTPQTQEVLVGCAVLAPSLDFELLVGVLQLDEDAVAAALDEAIAAGLLVESGRAWGGSYSFPHDLVREAILAEVGGHRLRRLHARCARALVAATVPGGPGSSAVALHLRGAGGAADPDETISWCRSAAKEAAALAAWDEALEHAEAAVELLTAAGGGVRLAEVCVEVADLRLRSTRGFARAVALLETALREYVGAGDLEAAGAVHGRLGGALSLHYSVMDVPRALEHLDAAERLRKGTRAAFHLVRGRAQAAMFGLRTSLLAASAAEASAIADESGRRDLAVLAEWAQAWAAFNTGDIASSFAHFDRSWTAAQEMGSPALAWGTVNAATLAANAYLLDPALARQWCRRGLGQPRFTAIEHGHDTAADQLTLALTAQGDLAGAREAVARLSEDATARRMLTFLEGRWEDAATAWRTAAAADEAAGDLHDAVTNLRWLATASAVLGDVDGAVTALHRALAHSTAGPQVPSEIAVRAELAAIQASTDPDAAREHGAAMEECLRAGGPWHGLLGPVELARAALAAIDGRRAEADAHHAAALAVLTAHGLPWHTASAHLAGADRLAAWGDRDASLAHRDAAQRIYSGLGAHDRWLERCAR